MDEAVHAVALRLLSRRALSVRELRTRLEKKGFTASEARAEARRLQAAGLLDDPALARAVARAQLTRGFGRRSVIAVLRRRMFAGADIEATLAALEGDENEAALAKAAARVGKKYAGKIQMPEVRRKILRALLTRGFDVADVRAAMASLASGDRPMADGRTRDGSSPE